MKQIKITISLGIILFLSACSTSRTSLDCKPGKDAGCRSISEVNKMVNNKELEERIKGEEKAPQESDKKLIARFGMKGKSLVSTINEFSKTKQAKDPVARVPEETMRIWVNSFTDDMGDYIKETYIHTVTKPGHWKEE